MANITVSNVGGFSKVENNDTGVIWYYGNNSSIHVKGDGVEISNNGYVKGDAFLFSELTNKRGATTPEEYAEILINSGDLNTQSPSATTADSTNQILADSAARDSFGRWRVSNTQSLIDLKQLYDALPSFYDEELGGGGLRVYDGTQSESVLSVSTNADYAIAQTKQRFNYQTGKSQLIEMTFSNMQAVADVVKRIGYFSSNTVAPFDSNYDGLWLETSAGSAKFAVGKNGAVTTIEQSSWNLDRFDGSGASGLTLDLSKTNILVMDFQWLGVGRVRFGFSINGVIYYAHEVLNANVQDAVYMRLPNQPLRYEIRSTGGAGSLAQICSTVQSEGGQNPLGVIRSVSTALDMQCSTANNIYAIYGIRLKSGRYSDVNLIDFSAFNENNDNFIYRILLNPTVSGTFTYADLANSDVQIAVSPTNSVATASGGIEIGSGVNLAADVVSKQLESALKLGVAIDGNLDEIVLTVQPLTAGADIFATLSWRELI